ncbi:PREDICTED: protein phosphatase 1F [Nanorana parkeri]|uniref:protein phosphatase 1F n=1 Tax=Nanorana parkeri TaxID=125878 RepID=UPI000854541E|nr:PREDICTED: protein phosphatase 1F [Nanorana parkeri]
MAEEAVGRELLAAVLRDLAAPEGHPRPQNRRLSRDEAEGELCEAVLRLVGGRGGPSWLAASLTRAAVDQALQSDLSSFVERKGDVIEGSQKDGDTEDLLSSDALFQHCLTSVQDISSQWQKQLPSPPNSICTLYVSAHAVRNTRRKMEDRHVTLLDFNQLFGITDGVARSYFAVFDGHGGLDAANYAATHVHVTVAGHEALMSDPARALKEAFQRTDAMFLKKAKRERLRSGTTGVCAVLEGERLHVAWLGDSQALLVQQGSPVTLMEPHKPEREDERERIEALGGCVTYTGCWRVNGTLAVSRAIGDIDQKPYVSGEADVTTHVLSGTEDFLVLGCDGFYDVVTSSEVPSLVLGHLLENGGDGQHVAERLVSAAKEGGSSDNITVMVVFLRDPAKVLEDFLAHGSVEAEPLFDFGGGGAEVG